jgi:hypothetical protein
MSVDISMDAELEAMMQVLLPPLQRQAAPKAAACPDSSGAPAQQAIPNRHRHSKLCSHINPHNPPTVHQHHLMQSTSIPDTPAGGLAHFAVACRPCLKPCR